MIILDKIQDRLCPVMAKIRGLFGQTAILSEQSFSCLSLRFGTFWILYSVVHGSQNHHIFQIVLRYFLMTSGTELVINFAPVHAFSLIHSYLQNFGRVDKLEILP